MEEIHSINLAFQHKPFNENSESHKAFKLKYLDLARTLQQKYDCLDLEKEIECFSK